MTQLHGSSAAARRPHLVLRIHLYAPVAILLSLVAALMPSGAAGQGINGVATVSAAGYGPLVTPESIAAAFGARLATRSEAAPTGLPLPLSLAGTMVAVLDGAGVMRFAPLLFVAPTQVNFVVPAGTAVGAATVTVTGGDGTVSTGPLQIAAVAPAIFTADASGQGLAAAVALRARADGGREFEPLVRFDQSTRRFVAVPLQLGPAGDQVFLVLFGGGVRRHGGLARVTARIGGEPAEVSFAGAAPDFVGVDQVNILVPRSLNGRGLVDVAVGVNGVGMANPVQLEVGVPPNRTPPMVNFGATPVLAGELIQLTGGDFAALAADNFVRLGGVEAPVTEALLNRLTVRVPFGVRTGPVSVRTPQGETVSQGAPLRVVTSISGRVEQTNGTPLAGVTVTATSAAGVAVTRTTDGEGLFVLPNIPAAARTDIRFQRPRQTNQLPFPDVLTSVRVLPDQDNQFSGPVALQSWTGPELELPPTVPAVAVQTDGVMFEVPNNVTVVFPDGATRGTVRVTRLENGRPPFGMPAGIFSSTVVQITTFGVRLTPGGKLTFPNRDVLPAGGQVRLFRLDQTLGSPTLGQFVDAGAATVSADGQRVETAAGAITETSIYFVARPSQVTTVVGRVVDADGLTPVRLAAVRAQGQEAFTDGNGGFALPNVPIRADGTVTVEAVFMRPGGRVERTEIRTIRATANALTPVTPDLRLPAATANRPPTLIGAPTNLTLSEGQTRDFVFEARDPDANQTAQPALTGSTFATLLRGNSNTHTLRLAPGFGTAGNYALVLSATDDAGASVRQNIALTVVRANPTPTLTSLQPNATTAYGPAFTLTLTGTNFVSGAIVRWDGSNRATTFVSATQLTAQITAADLFVVGTVGISVFNPAPGGGLSNAVNFTVRP